jgi:hypothetical protein
LTAELEGRGFLRMGELVVVAETGVKRLGGGSEGMEMPKDG